ncbi:MAG: FliM/FliN family flagellar motor switch protein [Myxococcaceae bacterium]|nr:FliM/FliN family flagellar motor switch protein [Myxococcaceae bacterium]
MNCKRGMYDTETACTVTTQPPKGVGSSTVKIRPFRWKPPFRASRAHVMLARRPALGHAAVQLLEACAKSLSAQLGAPLTLKGELTPTWMNPFDGLSRFSVFAMFDLTAAGTIACLEVDALTLGGMLARVAGSPQKLALPLELTRLEEAAFGWLVLLAVEAVRASPVLETLFGPRLMSVHTDRAVALGQLDCRKRHLSFQVRPELDGSRGIMRLIVPSLAVERACHHVEESVGGPLDRSVGEARVTARLMAGRAGLSLADLGSLSARDVVVFDGLKLDGGRVLGPARIESRTFELAGTAGATGFTFTRARTRALTEELQMPNDVADPALPVEVEIELTRLLLPIAELATLKPGAVLPLHINAAQPVTLRIGDRAVARAEIVEVDGELGARIISMQK